MKKQIEFYLHEENIQKAKLIMMDENSTYSEILRNLSGNVSSEEMEIFQENQENPKAKKNPISVPHRSHIHCHRCHKIEIKVTFNGQIKVLNLPPSSTGEKVLSKAAKEFGITEGDSTDMILQLTTNKLFQPKDHIGSFVSFPACQIDLLLVPNAQMQG